MNAGNAIDRRPIDPQRVRRIAGQSFAFIPHRFLRDGFLATLSQHEMALYLFLALAANRDGISFYNYDRICSLLMLTVDDYIRARNGLIAKDLLAFDSTRFQLLSLPDKPACAAEPALNTSSDLAENDPATVRQAIRRSLGIASTDDDDPDR